MRIPHLIPSFVATSLLFSPILLSALTGQVESAAFINLVPGHPFTAEVCDYIHFSR